MLLKKALGVFNHNKAIRVMAGRTCPRLYPLLVSIRLIISYTTPLTHLTSINPNLKRGKMGEEIATKESFGSVQS